MNDLGESYQAAETALKIERLERQIAILENRVEVETERADYFEALYRRFSGLMRYMDDMVQTYVVIECGDVWEIALEDWWADGSKSHRRTYEGRTFQEAMEAMVAGENKKKEAK